MFLLLLLAWLPQAVLVKNVPPAPVKVRLKSSNMSHLLQWEGGAGTAAEVTYSISFHTDRGVCCSVVPGCERVVEDLLCDLTEAFRNPEETYYMKVTAHFGSERSSSLWHELFPLRDTELQLPVLELVHRGSSLYVNMYAPVPALLSIYNSFYYDLNIQRDSEQTEVKHQQSLQTYVVPEVKVGSQYCVSICFSDPIVPRSSNFSSPQCVRIHSPIAAERPLAAIAVMLVLLLLVLFALVYSGCICLRQQALPSTLAEGHVKLDMRGQQMLRVPQDSAQEKQTSVRHLEKRVMVFFLPPVSYLSVFKQAAPSSGQTEHCSSESDYSEDESDSSVAPYTGKGSLCSSLSLSSSAPHSNEARKEGAEQDEKRLRAEEGQRMEEVNLLTLTFSRDTDLECDSAVVVSEMQLPVWAGAEEQQEPEVGFEEECCQSGYISR